MTTKEQERVAFSKRIEQFIADQEHDKAQAENRIRHDQLKMESCDRRIAELRLQLTSIEKLFPSSPLRLIETVREEEQAVA